MNERRKLFLNARTLQTPKHSAEFNVLADRAANSTNRGIGLAAVESFKTTCQKLSPKEKQEYGQLLEERKKTIGQLVDAGHVSKTDKNYLAALGDIERLLQYLDEPEVSS